MRQRRFLTVLGILFVTLAAGVLGARPAPATGTVVSSISAGWVHTCAVTDVGGVQCWGDNNYGQLGNGMVQSVPPYGSRIPVDVVGLDTGVSVVDAGESHTCALTTAGGVKCWGDGLRLGSGGWETSPTPVDVVGLDEGASSISTLFSHTCAVTTAGGVKCWGSNAGGGFGADCGSGWCLSPEDVLGLGTEAVGVAAGCGHACALTTGGGVKCWGRNTYGELGDGTTTDSAVPVDVLDDGGVPLTDVAAVAAGCEYTCALTTAGGVLCWGFDESGQLGDGISGEGHFSPTPTGVQGLDSGVLALDAGVSHACALTEEGAVKCWGDNEYGQLGVPVWPEEEYGQAGDPSGDRCPPPAHPVGVVLCSDAPVDVIGLDGPAEAVTAGWRHTCAALTAGGAKCWGDNGAGQLGDGTKTWRTAPVDVLFDSDDDGCADVREEGPNANEGGLRSSKYFWDFFDTPDAGNVRDGVVRISDVLRVIGRYGTDDDDGTADVNRDTDPLSLPPESGYHPAYDRGAVVGSDPWEVAPPDGVIRVGDIAAVLAQYGHSCR